MIREQNILETPLDGRILQRTLGFLLSCIRMQITQSRLFLFIFYHRYHLSVLLNGYHDVFWLQVPMDDTFFLYSSNSDQDLEGDILYRLLVRLLISN